MAKQVARTALDELSSGGAFKRADSTFRNWVKPGGEHPPASGRYHLYASYACPWASRCLAVRSLRGLTNAISVSIVHPTWQKTRPDDSEDTHNGWVFANPGGENFTSTAGHGSFPADFKNATVDHVLNKRSIRDVYEHVGYTGKYTVPILFDKETNTIVNNESTDIIRMLGEGFAEFEEDPANDVVLFPEDNDGEAKKVDDRIYNSLNNGVYRAGFAQSQAAFDTAVNELFDTLDWLEERLSKSRFLLGNTLTASDLRAYVTLVRFDPVYVVYFKCSKKMIREYPNVYAYTRDIHQHPRIGVTTEMNHIRTHYFTSHTTLNAYSIIPPYTTDMDLPHNRAEM